MKKKILIYGANGFTGSLIVREAIKRGLEFTIAGRNEIEITKMGMELNLEYLIFDLDHENTVNSNLKGYWLLLNCAGPYSRTAKIMIDACLITGTHYLDITGEINVFEYAQIKHLEAEKANVIILPGVGYDVVPTDCLSLYLRDRMPDASKLELAMMSEGGRGTHGTLKTSVEAFKTGFFIRENGLLKKVKPVHSVKDFKFSNGKIRTCLTIPWGDVSTAHHTTGIPDIEVYRSTKPSQINTLRRYGFIMPLLGIGFVQDFLKKRIAKGPRGPTDEQVEKGRSYLYGKVSNKDDIEEAWMETPNGYAITVDASITIIEKLLVKSLVGGYYTPASAFGIKLIEDLKNVKLITEI